MYTHSVLALLKGSPRPLVILDFTCMPSDLWLWL